MRKRLIKLSAVHLVGVALAVAACPKPDPRDDSDPHLDGGPQVDAGPDADAGPEPDAGPAPDAATFCEAVHGALCDGFSSCACTLEGRTFTASTCLQVRVDGCLQELAPAVPLLDNGEVVIDPAGAAACLAGIEGLVDDCRIVADTTLPIDCAVILLDSVELGEPCASAGGLPMRCASGAGFCGGDTCAPLPGNGVECLSGLLCAPGLACTGGICGAQTAPPPLLDVDAPCSQSAQCLPGLACMEGLCAAGPARGSLCSGPTCSSEDACVRSYETRVCGARKSVGEPCAWSPDGECEVGLFCDVGTCAPLPAENEACGGELECAAPTLCDTDTMVCVVPPGESEPCLIGPALCAIGLGCNVDNICVPGPSVGEACLIPNHLCADGLACDFTSDGSFCAERRGEGGVCQNDVCLAGLYCGPSGTCEPALPIGTPCAWGGCDVTDECSDLAGGFTCQSRPDTDGDPCFEECGGALTCLGPGGVCAPSLCASP